MQSDNQTCCAALKDDFNGTYFDTSWFLAVLTLAL